MLETLFAALAEAVFGYVLEQAGVADRVRSLLRREPQKLAFQVALTRAYSTFAQRHPQWAAALFDQHFLQSRFAVPLLAQYLTRAGPPDPAKLAEAYADQQGLHAERRTRTIAELTPVAGDFLTALTTELRARAEFQPIFDSQSLDAIAETNAQTAEQIAALRTEMQSALAALPGEVRQPLEQLTATVQDLKAILERVTTDTATAADLAALARAHRAGAVTITASGERSLATGGDVAQSVLVTGDHNTVFYGVDAATIAAALRQVQPQAAHTELHSAASGQSAASFAPNPFGRVGRIDDPDEFFGRALLLHRIFEELGKGSNLSLIGEREIGKSSLLSMIMHQGPAHLNRAADTFFEINMQIMRDEEDFFAELCHQLGIETCRGGRLGRALRQRGKCAILCLDEIEKMRRERFTADVRDELRGFADGAKAPLTLVIASSLPLAELFPDKMGEVSPLANICSPLTVPPFTRQEGQAFIAARLQGTGMHFSPDEINDLLIQSQSHPARLQQAAAALYRQKSGRRD